VADGIVALNQRLRIPADLGARGGTADAVEEMVAYAVDDVSTLTNPVRATAEDYRALFQASLGG
jgi:hypothetical protein